MLLFDKNCESRDLSDLHELHQMSLNLLVQMLEFYNHDAVLYDFSRYESIVFPRTMQKRKSRKELDVLNTHYVDFLSNVATENLRKFMNTLVSRKQAKGWVLEWVKDVGEYNYKRYFKIMIAPKPKTIPYRRLDRLDLIDFEEPYEFAAKERKDG